MRAARGRRRRFGIRALGLAALAIVGALLCACARSSTPRPPNLLLVIADDLGVADLALYGEAEVTPPTPHIDALAARGVVFSSAYANPLCSPSRAAMLTGRYPRRYGLGSFLRSRDRRAALPPSALTLPRVLARAPTAYANSAVGKWHLGSALGEGGERHPLASGFDWYAGSFTNFESTAGSPAGYFSWLKNTNGELAMVERYATSDTADDAIARLREMPEPWLLWVAFNAPHKPFHTPPDELFPGAPPSDDAGRFAAAVTALDTELGRLLATIDFDETVVVFVSDNGTPSDISRARSDRRAKGSLNQSGIRVPLIVAGPPVAAPGRTSDALVHVVDLLPTFAELAGIAPAQLQRLAPDGLDGVSLAPLLQRPDAPAPRELVYVDKFRPNGRGELSIDRRAVLDSRYKLIASAEGLRYFGTHAGNDEGPDLLDAMDDAQRRAFGRLRDGLDAIFRELEAERVSGR